MPHCRPARRIVPRRGVPSPLTICRQCLNEDLRSFAQRQLSQAQLPASPKDMQDQIEHLTRIGEGIASRMPEQGKKTFWQRLFG
ncbi:hypothetical protein GCM10023187_53270 [Nibrella viscosa]|uniref:Uncharacterized protein n=1 Tax=Nibrella viscosa TaxID=1084524 RepID=A0ABP8KYF8_9BACT